jgi:ribosomal protein L11
MLTKDQKRRYEETLEMAQEELEQLDQELAEEIARSKARINELQEAKTAVKKIVEGTCARLGIEIDQEGDDLGVAEVGERA